MDDIKCTLTYNRLRLLLLRLLLLRLLRLRLLWGMDILLRLLLLLLWGMEILRLSARQFRS